MNRFGLRGRRFRPVCLVLVLGVISCGGAAATADPVVADHLEAFFEAFLDRQLRGNELREVTDEFIKIHTGEGKKRASIQEIAKSFDVHTKWLVTRKGRPADFTTRQIVLEANYFSPLMKNTIELRLLTEPDPVRVADPRSKRLMTERDLVALANLRHFARSNDDPQPRELSRQQIDRLAAELNRLCGDHPNAQRMPQFFGEADSFWSGVRHEWPQLNAEEKRLVRTYADKTWRIRLTFELFAKLWGLNPQAARSRYMDDMSIRMGMMTDLILQHNNMSIFWDKIFPP
ncbi:MAG TPA: hypothetical protein VJ302_25055 [Blastocatellia bacterium]|nr:hypothetical protein [Blastocatellia bacterium]